MASQRRSAWGYPDDMAQIVPELYYADAGPAIEFMEKAFGFEIVHAFAAPRGGC